MTTYKIVLIVPTIGNKVMTNVKSHVVVRDPYEMKITFDDDSRITFNLSHVLAYTVIEEDSE